jgi:hypothetical protein
MFDSFKKKQFSYTILRQDAAALMGMMLQDDDSEKAEVTEDETIDIVAEDVTCAKMKDCGLFYITAQTMNSQASVSDPSKKGVYINWKDDGPYSVELFEMQSFTGVDVHEFLDFGKSEGQIFIPCPLEQTLSTDLSRVKRAMFPLLTQGGLLPLFLFTQPMMTNMQLEFFLPFSFLLILLKHQIS